MMREAASFPFRTFGESMTSVIPKKENIVKRPSVGVVSVISHGIFHFILVCVRLLQHLHLETLSYLTVM